MQVDDANRAAVHALLTDANAVVAFTKSEEVRGSAVLERVVHIRAWYRDLVRRSLPLTMTDVEQAAFQRNLDHVRACLQSLGESV